MNIQEKYTKLMRLYGILRFNAGKSDRNFQCYLDALPLISTWKAKHRPQHTEQVTAALWAAYS